MTTTAGVPWDRLIPAKGTVLSVCPLQEEAMVSSSLHCERRQSTHFMQGGRACLPPYSLSSASGQDTKALNPSRLTTPPNHINLYKIYTGKVRTPATARCSAECQTLNHNLGLFGRAFYISLNFVCVSDYQFC